LYAITLPHLVLFLNRCDPFLHWMTSGAIKPGVF